MTEGSRIQEKDNGTHPRRLRYGHIWKTAYTQHSTFPEVSPTPAETPDLDRHPAPPIERVTEETVEWEDVEEATRDQVHCITALQSFI